MDAVHILQGFLVTRYRLTYNKKFAFGLFILDQGVSAIVLQTACG